jgi:hypothetical protein
MARGFKKSCISDEMDGRGAEGEAVNVISECYDRMDCEHTEAERESRNGEQSKTGIAK